jgi:hypothetical protein
MNPPVTPHDIPAITRRRALARLAVGGLAACGAPVLRAREADGEDIWP